MKRGQTEAELQEQHHQVELGNEKKSYTPELKGNARQGLQKSNKSCE